MNNLPIILFSDFFSLSFLRNTICSLRLVQKICLLLLLVITANKLQAQDTMMFTKKQMYADFDTLTANVRAISPHLSVKKALWRYNPERTFRILRKRIDTVRSVPGFVLLLNRALTACQDHHTSLLDLPDAYRSANNQFKLYLPIAYIDGQYVLVRSFKDGIQMFPAGSIITHVGQQTVDTYVAELTTEMTLRYDIIRKKFYSETFYRNQKTLFAEAIRITLKTPDNKSAIATIATGTRIDFLHPVADTIRNQVTYWSDHQVIYVKLYRMDEALIPMIQKKIAAFRHQPQPVQRIIIDLRDNIGGSDAVWQSLYEAILPNQITYPLSLDGLKASRLPADYLSQLKINRDSVVPDKKPLLKPFGFYTFYRGDWKLTPTDSSLNFTGKVIVLGNENNYSSGASAFNLPRAYINDQIFLVSRPTGMFLGTGYSPVILTLPNSKLKYRIEPAIEVTNAQLLADLMHDRYDVALPWTLQEIQDRENYRGNSLGITYLKTQDPFIRKALEL